MTNIQSTFISVLLRANWILEVDVTNIKKDQLQRTSEKQISSKN